MHNYHSIKLEIETNLSNYGIEKTTKKFNKIYHQYVKNCIQCHFVVYGKLDTFKKVACLMAAMIRHQVVTDEQENDKIALDISLSMIENPVWYEGPRFDQPYSLEPISIEQLKNNQNDESIYHRMLENMQVNRKVKKKIHPIRYKNLDLADILLLANTFQLIYNIVKTEQQKNKSSQKQFIKNNLQG